MKGLKCVALVGGFLLATSLALSSPVQLEEVAEIPMGRVQAMTSDGEVVYAGVSGVVRIYNVFNRDFPQLISDVKGHSSTIVRMEVVGDKLFVLWEKEGLEIFDVTRPYEPLLLGEFPEFEDPVFTNFSTFEIDENRLFLAGKGYLALIDISDLNAPSLLTRANIDGKPLCMDWFKNRLYVANGNKGIYVVGLSKDNRFFLLGHQPGTYTSLQLHNNIIIYGRWDAEKPNEKKIFGRRLFNIPFLTPMTVQIFDGIVYAGGYKNFAIYELIEGDPVLVWNLDGMPTLDFGKVDEDIYLANDHMGIHVFDVTNFRAPMEIGHVETYDTPKRICIYDNVLYIAAGRSGVLVYDISDPERPLKIGKVYGVDLAIVWDVQIHNGLLYILGARSSIKEDVFMVVASPKNLSAFDEIAVISTARGPDKIGRIEFGNDFCAVSLGKDGIALMPLNAGHIYTSFILKDYSAQFYDIHFDGDLLYASDFLGGYHVFDLSKEFPAEIGYIHTSQTGGNGFEIVGKYIIAADGQSGVSVIDISNPEKLRLVSTYPSVWGMDVRIFGDYAYVADGPGQLKVFDISSLPTLKMVADMPKNGYWTQLAGFGNYIFAVDMFQGIHVYKAIVEVTLAKTTNLKNMIPTKLEIVDNYPNPFNASTEIDFVLPNETHVDLTIFDATGRKVKVLIQDVLPSGKHTLIWNAKYQPSGTYFAVLSTPNETVRKSLILVK